MTVKIVMQQMLLSVFYVWGTVVGTGNTMVNETDGGPWSHGFHSVGVININCKCLPYVQDYASWFIYYILFNLYEVIGAIAVFILYKNKLRQREIK